MTQYIILVHTLYLAGDSNEHLELHGRASLARALDMADMCAGEVVGRTWLVRHAVVVNATTFERLYEVHS